MNFPETKYVNGYEEALGGERKSIHISVDQFTHYQEAMAGYLMNKNPFHPLRLSAVRFELPFNSKDYRLMSPTVWVEGDGEGSVQVFTQGILTERVLREGNINQGNEVWRLFETDGFDWKDHPKTGKREMMPKTFRERKLESVYTTRLYPFINRGEWPFEGKREFLLYLNQGTYLQLIADRRENKKEDTFTITYLADKRVWQPYQVSVLSRTEDNLWMARSAPRSPKMVKAS